jgi:hypothetical protein
MVKNPDNTTTTVGKDGLEKDETSRGKYKSFESKERQVKKESQSFGVPITVIGCVVMIIISPWIFYLSNYQSESGPEVNVKEAIDDIKNYIISNATDLILQKPSFNFNITKYQDRLSENLEDFVKSKYYPYYPKKQEIEIFVTYWRVEVKPEFRESNEFIRYPWISSEDNNKLDLRVGGFYHDLTVPFSYEISGELLISSKMLDDDGSKDENANSLDRVVTFEESITLPHLFIEYKLAQFQAQSQSAYSDLARMTRYMLTTLARMRAYNKIEYGPGHSHKNIINEGDVELALNIALILEEALLFRAYDRSSVLNIDRNYYQVDPVENDNPTGKRQWGSAEISNHYDYTTRREFLNDKESRLFSVLVDKYVRSGYIDPADLIGLYLVLDQGNRPTKIGTPKDTFTIFDEKYETRYLMDPRDQNDPTDVTNVEYFLSLPKNYKQGHSITHDPRGKTQYNSVQLKVDQDPDYIINDKDFTIKGLDTPRGWYTTAELRFGTRSLAKTRTSPIIPERPEDHDFRMEWKLNIKGKFTLSINTNEGVSDVFTPRTIEKKIINLDFPVNIFIWFETDPKIPSITFQNLNAGTAVSSGWLITSESTMVEYFEREFWAYLKKFVSIGFDGFGAILPFFINEKGFEYYYDGIKMYVDNLLMGYDSHSSNWLTDILLFQTRSLRRIFLKELDNFLVRFEIFMADYFLDYLDQYDEEFGLFNITDKPQFPYPELLPWISALGYETNLNYNRDINVLNITFIQDNGYFTLLISGYNKSKNELSITLKSFIELPDTLKLHTTITTVESDSPGIFADGELFNTYKFSTNSYSKPSTPFDDNSNFESNDQLLLTRSKFGEIYRVTQLELPDLILDETNEDINFVITLLVPKKQQESLPALEDVVSNIDLNREPLKTATADDELIQNRIYLARFMGDLGESLLDWIGDNKPNSKIGIDISINFKDNRDSFNLTIFLTEYTSTIRFLEWLGNNGLKLLLILNSPENVQVSIAQLLSKNNPYFTSGDLEKIDLELYNKELDNQLQNSMRVSSNVFNLYSSAGFDQNNLTILVVYSGSYIASTGNRLISTKPQSNSKIQTISQIYYSYQVRSENDINTYLLIGTSWFLKPD